MITLYGARKWIQARAPYTQDKIVFKKSYVLLQVFVLGWVRGYAVWNELWRLFARAHLRQQSYMRGRNQQLHVRVSARGNR